MDITQVAGNGGYSLSLGYVSVIEVVVAFSRKGMLDLALAQCMSGKCYLNWRIRLLLEMIRS